MKQYLDLMQNILDTGVWQSNRTGVRTKMIPGVCLKFDLRDGFPVITTRKLPIRNIIGELLAFIRGYDTSEGFRSLGCSFWDANATAPGWINSEPYKEWCKKNDTEEESGYLGRIYGKQWTDWKTTTDGDNFNQLHYLLDQIRVNPTSRRLLVTALRPDEFSNMALPPCHYVFQIIIEQESKVMHLLWSQRSCDVFLGIPANIVSYAVLLEIIAKATGYTPGTLTGFLADVHVYETHLEQIHEQLSRVPLNRQDIHLTINMVEGRTLETIEPIDIQLVNYKFYPAIKAEMAL